MGSSCQLYSNLQAVTISLDIYEQIGINEYMCSSDCPCKDVEAKSAWTDGELEVRGRDMPCKAWDFSGVKNGQTVEYTTYKQCILETEETTELGESSSGFAIFAKKFREQLDFEQIMSWIEFFETKYDCAGICQPSVFFWSKSIEQGPPSKRCIDDI